MPTRSLQQLEIHQLALRLHREAYPHVRTIRDYTFRDQMCRSLLSIPSNIAEGYGRRNRRFFVVFLDYANGSLYEFSTQLGLGVDHGLMDRDTAAPLMVLCDELAAKINRFRAALTEK